MAEIEENNILQFLDSGKLEQVILLIGCENLLYPIRQKIPNAIIYVTEKENIENEGGFLLCKCLSVPQQEKIRFYGNSFDYIVTGDSIEQLINPVPFLRALHFYIKEEGKVVASFGNVSHWSVINELMSGHWKYKNEGIIKRNVLRFFTAAEIINLFKQSQYKNITFAAVYDNPPPELYDRFIRCGFKNQYNDLSVWRWIVCGAKSDEKVKFLRSCFDARIREKLVFLLRRIENDIDSAENVKEILEVCKNNTIAEPYIAALIESAIASPEKVIVTLAVQLYENEARKNGILLLEAGRKLYPDSSSIIFSLASLLYLENHKKQALELLETYQGTDQDILELYKKVRDK